MTRIALIHWNAAEARERAALIRELGFVVRAKPLPPPEWIRSLAAAPAAAIVIDLTRSPSQGRDLGVLLRQRSATRHIPLVFAGGKRPAVAQVRRLLPDATFVTWERMAGALRRALARPVVKPVVPGSAFAAYAGRPLAHKLGIKAGMRVSLLRPPPGFTKTLGKLPEGVRILRGRPAGAEMVVWFVRQPIELQRRITELARSLASSVLWIAWPKGGSAATGSLTQVGVRRAGLESGLVDYKICSIDERWSALLFKRR